PIGCRRPQVGHKTGQFCLAVIPLRHCSSCDAAPDDRRQFLIGGSTAERAAQKTDAGHLVAAIAVAGRASGGIQLHDVLDVFWSVLADMELCRRRISHTYTDHCGEDLCCEDAPLHGPKVSGTHQAAVKEMDTPLTIDDISKRVQHFALNQIDCANRVW